MANYVSVEQLSLARIIVINNMNGKDVANHRYEVMYNAELFANSEVINEKKFRWFEFCPFAQCLFRT